MLFLLTITFLLILSVAINMREFSSIRSKIRQLPAPGLSPFFGWLWSFAAIAFVMLASAPLYQLILLTLEAHSGHGVPGDASMKFSVYLLLAGASLSLAWYAYRAWAGPGRGPFGVLAIVACCYLVFVAIDHLTFFADDKAGYADLAYFVDSGAVKDIQGCGPIVLVRDALGSEEASYRCPHDIALGAGFVSDPFVPWPSYTAGKSRDLAAALSAMWENAAKP